MAEAGLQAAQNLAEGRAGEAGVLAQQARELRSQLAEATSRWQEGEVLRRRLHNTIMASTPMNVMHLGHWACISGSRREQPDPRPPTFRVTAG